MAIQWGGWAGGSGTNQFRVGFDISVVGTSISVSSYVESKYSINDSVNINYTGIWAGRSVRFAWNQGGGTRFVETLSTTGALGQNYNNGAYLTDIYNGASPSVDTVVSVAAQRPGPPSSGPQPYQVLNQTSVRLSWGSTTSSHGADPIEDQLIVRRTSDGVDIHNSIQAGAVRDVSPLQPNTQYQAFARIRNAAGWSDWTSGPYFSTPVDPPAAPSGMTLTRGNDGLHTLSWTNNATSGAPYGALGIDRWDNVTNSWSRIATPTNNPTSFADSTTVADRRYQYRIHAANGSGVSGFVYTAPAQGLETTPAAPSDCAAVKSGANIVINWTNKASYPVQTEVWHAANGVWDATPLFTVAAGVATAQHNAPSTSVTHTYRVRAKSANPVLYSGYSTSGVVQLAAPPNAPTPVGPSGAQNGLVANQLQWVHNPVDSSTQRIFQVRHRTQGSTTWTTPAAVTSAVSSWTLPAGTYANGQVVEWQVMTWGQHATGSPWSATSAFPLSTPPTATINAPGNAWNLPALTMTWGYFDAEGQGQLAWEAELESGGVVLERRTGSSELSTTFARNLPDNTTWLIRVRARDSTGLWSTWSTQTFSVGYPKPAKPTISAQWIPDGGYCTLQLSNPPILTAPRPDDINLATNPKLTDTYGTTAVPAIATNYARNPRALSSSFAVYNPGTGEAVTNSYLTGQSDGPPGTGITSYGRSLITTARTGGSSGWTALGGGQRDPMAGVAGDIVTASVWIRYTGPGTLEGWMRCAVHMDSTAVTIASVPYTAQSGVWTRVSATVTATGAYNAVGFWAYHSGTGAWVAPVGSTTDATGSMYELASTPSEYFDGATSNVDPFAYTWSGTANNSASTKRYAVAVSGTAPAPRSLSGGGLSANVGMTTGGNARVYVEGDYLVVDSITSTSGATSAYIARSNTAAGDAMKRLNLVPGKTYAMGVLYSQDMVHTTTAGLPRQMSTVYRNATGVDIFNHIVSNVAPNEVQVDTPLTLAFTVPADAQDYNVRLVSGAQGMLDRAKFRNLIICEGATEAEALANVQTYFDGDTAAGERMGYHATYSFTGVANRSTSRAVYTPLPETAFNDVYRSIDGGDWVQIAADVPTQTTIADYTAAAAGVNRYRAVAKSLLPSTSESDVVSAAVSTTHGGSAWLSAGPGFTNICRAYFNLQIAEKVGRAEKVAHLFAGQTYPTELSGEGLEETVDVKFLSLPNIEAPNHTEWDEWVKISRMSGPHLYRDFEGRYMLVSISPVVGERAHLGAYNGSFTARRIQS